MLAKVVFDMFNYIESYIDWLESAYLPLKYSAYNSLGISILDLCGSIVVCYNYRKALKSSKSWLEVFVSCLFIQFGGTTLTNSLLLGQTPSWIMSFTAFPAFCVAYWLTFHCPIDLYWSFISFTSKLIGVGFIHFAQLGAAISSGHAITSWGVDKALFNTFHVNSTRIGQSALACVLAGMLSGSGGGLLSDIFGFSSKPSFVMLKTTEFFSAHNYTVSATATRAFLLAVLYYILITPYFMPWNSPSCNKVTSPSYYCDINTSGLLTKKQGHMIIVLLQICHLILKTNFDIDVFVFIYKYLLIVFYISPVISPDAATTDVGRRTGLRSDDISITKESQSSQSTEALLVKTPSRSRSKTRKSVVPKTKTTPSDDTAASKKMN